MAADLGYRIYLRVRLGMPLTSDQTRLRMEIEHRDVELTSQKPDEPLRQTSWVVMSARGFVSEEEARAFGDRLRARIELAAFAAYLGADCGSDKATFGISEAWARGSGVLQGNEWLVGTIHGLMILPDDNLTKVALSQFTATFTCDPEKLLCAIAELSEAGFDDLGSCAAPVRLLNAALMSPEPLAKAVLSFSAVEALGQVEGWSERQKGLRNQIVRGLRARAAEGDLEMQEIADAIERLHRIGLRQGVMRVLDRLDLKHLKKEEWDRLYGIRSGIFHGTHRDSDLDLNRFANEVIKLCGEIVLECARASGIHVPSVARRHYAHS